MLNKYQEHNGGLRSQNKGSDSSEIAKKTYRMRANERAKRKRRKKEMRKRKNRDRVLPMAFSLVIWNRWSNPIFKYR